MKRKSNILKGVQVQGLRLNEDDVLVVKYPVDENGQCIYSFKQMEAYHNMIKDKVNSNVLSIPNNIELLKVRKDSISIDENK